MDQIPPEFIIDEEPVPLGVPTETGDIWEQLKLLIARRAELVEDLKQVEKQEERKRRQLFLSLLKVTDAFDRIFRDTDLTQLDEISRNRLRSIRTTSMLLENVLEQEDIIAMEELEGHPFDTYTQEAVTIEIHTDKPNNLVLEVREKGYRWQGRVLRKAKVVVSKQQRR